MSKKINQQLSCLEDLCSYSRGSWRGGPPDAQDLLDSVLSLWVCRVYDTLHPSLTVPEKDRVLRRWLTYHQKVSYSDVLRLSDKCSSELLLEHASYGSFKRSLADFQDVGVFLAPMRQWIEQWILEKDPNSFYQAYSAFVFPLRAPIHSKELEELALTSYLNDEADMWEGLAHPCINKKVRRWVRHYSDEVLMVKHGSGSTADVGRDIQDKYLALAHDQILEYVVKRTPYSDLLGGDYLRRTSKTIFVPKSYKSLRTISMEPAALMWWQQHVLSCLNAAIARSALRHHYDPADQESNRERAWIGSIDGSYATIDLSSASDSVSWSLVKQAFKGTSLLPWLFATRSTSTVLPTGEVIHLRKFAPMGSALCFPVEVILFCAMVETVLDELDLSHDYVVYGDDIIVPIDAADAVISMLESHGFRVNQRKTWKTTGDRPLYRESCGGEYIDGVDVTPLRIPRNFQGFAKVRTSSAFTALIDLANECYTSSPSCRLYIIKILNRLPRKLRPMFSTGESGVYSPNATNWHLDKRWRDDYQREEFRHGTPRVESRLGIEGIRYIEYLRLTEHRMELGENPLTVKVGHSAPRATQSTWSSPW